MDFKDKEVNTRTQAHDRVPNDVSAFRVFRRSAACGLPRATIWQRCTGSIIICKKQQKQRERRGEVKVNFFEQFEIVELIEHCEVYVSEIYKINSQYVRWYLLLLS